MRWFVGLFIGLVVAWLVFTASPYYALYEFGRAVEAGDLATIRYRVNFSAVRISLSKQLVTAYLVATGRESELKSSNKGLVAAAGSTLVDPLLAQYVSPEALADFLSGRRGADAGSAGNSGGLSLPGTGSAPGGAVSSKSLEAAWRLFLGSESRGFRAILFPVPPDKPPQDQFRLQFRLTGLTWRLVGVEVPQAVQQRLIQEMMRRDKPA
jgi:hypothetical protein